MLGSLSEERETECKEEMEDEGACVCCGYKRLSGIDMMELYAAAGHLYLFGIYQEIIYVSKEQRSLHASSSPIF